ncbi:MAG: lytic transglycosylase domain-containing protein, partial [Acetobacteraceae bacterium]
MLSRVLPALLAAGLVIPAAAAAARNPMPAVHADDWSQASEDAQAYADPVAAKLVLYYRLLAPGQATAEQVSAFLAANPDWPNQALLERRRQEALAAGPNGPDAVAQCTARPLTLPGALAHCATVLAAAGDTQAAASDAREAWTSGLDNPAVEAGFLAQWGASLTQSDNWARFDHFAWNNSAEAARQLPRLTPAQRKAAKARLALIANTPDAIQLMQALPAPARNDPGLVLDAARTLRRAHRNVDAFAFWRSEGFTAEADAEAHRAAFWTERNILARELLKDGGADEDAYRMADDRQQTGSESEADAAFLAGFIALHRLHDPARATAQFQRLADVSKAAITQARAHYWLGRADAAAGRDARADYQAAAAYPTTFYGQLAAGALNE